MISAVIIAKNEEKQIVDCIERLSFCDEVIVIDDYSEDRTGEVAKRMGAKISKKRLSGSFSDQRNFGLEKARGEWVLFIDADERVSDQLASEIKDKTREESAVDGYFLKRSDHLWGKKMKHGELGSIHLLRLARRNKGLWIGDVHERWNVKGPTDYLTNELFHFPHQTLTEFLTEINHYTTMRAEEIFKKKERVKPSDVVLYPVGKFFVNYILKAGFLDGIEGLVFAYIMSFHSFLVRGKVWLRQNK